MLTTGLNLCQGNRSLAGLESAELATGAQDVSATASTKVDIETAPAEDGLKRLNGDIGWALIRAAGKGVEGDQVDLTSKVPE